MARRRRRSRRRFRRNQLNVRTLGQDVLKPALGATAGYVGARVLGNVLPMDPTWGRPLAGIGTIAAVFLLSPKIGLVRQNAGPLIMGAGLTLLQDILARVLGGGVAAAPVVSPATAGVGEYVTEPVLGEYYDVSDAGSPYDSMMGAYYAEGVDPADMASVEGMMTRAEHIAGVDVYQAAAGGLGRTYYAAAGLGADVPMKDTVEPFNAALPAAAGPGIAEPITEQFATPEGRGYAGGIFARHLFSGMMGG